MGEWMNSALSIPQYHDWGALEQGTELPTAHRVPQHKWLPLLRVCVHFGWDKCRAQIPSMGHHTWPHVTSLSPITAQLNQYEPYYKLAGNVCSQLKPLTSLKYNICTAISALLFYTANKYSVLRNVVVVGCVYEAEEKCSLTLFLCCGLCLGRYRAQEHIERFTDTSLITPWECVCVYEFIKSAWLDITQKGGINLLN